MTTAGSPVALITSSAHESLLTPGVGLGDDEVDTRVDGPGDLLLEHRAHRPGRVGVAVDEGVRVRDVPCQERARFRGHLLRDGERLPVERLELAFPADDAQLLAVRVVGQRLDDLRAGVDEVAVELRDDLRMLEHGLGDECARLQVPTPLELEDVALGTDHRATVEALDEPRPVRFRGHPSTPFLVSQPRRTRPRRAIRSS